ncbi:MAG TPA: DUF222 domain-containing protein [Trebonia sp.]
MGELRGGELSVDDTAEMPEWLEDEDPDRYAWAADADFTLLDPLGQDRPSPDDAPVGEGRDGDVPDPGDPDEGGLRYLTYRIAAAGADPEGKTDGELIDAMAEWQAIEAMVAGRRHREAEELMRRRRPSTWDKRDGWREGRRVRMNTPDEGRDPVTGKVFFDGIGGYSRSPVLATREAEAETALALGCTKYAAGAHVELTYDLAVRLPRTYAELKAGRATAAKVKIVAAYTTDLTDEGAGTFDARIAPHLKKLTTGELRDRAARLLVSIDAEAAELRRERAQRRADVKVRGNTDGTATIAVDRIPPQLGAAAMARIDAIAQMYAKAGAEEPFGRIRAKLAVALLLGVLPDIDVPPHSGGVGGAGGPGGGMRPWPGPGHPDPWDNRTVPVPDFPLADVPGVPGLRDLGLDDLPPDGLWSLAGAGDPGPDPRASAAPEPCDPPGGAPGPRRHPEDVPDTVPWPRVPATAGREPPGCLVIPPAFRPEKPGRIRLTVPWRSLLGLGSEAGDLTWAGPVTPGVTRDLALAAAADPSAAWQLIITDDEGRAVNCTILRRRCGIAAGEVPGMISDVTVTISVSDAAGYIRNDDLVGWCASALAWELGKGSRESLRGTGALAGPRAGAVGPRDGTAKTDGQAELARILARVVTAANSAGYDADEAAWIDEQAGGCSHAMETSQYQIRGRLRQWLNVRDRTCRNPVCRQPADHCDQDHAIPYDQGGRSCGCNLGAECRGDHQLKQLPGWHVTMDSQGNFTWRTPAGRVYRKEPHRYAI